MKFDPWILLFILNSVSCFNFPKVKSSFTFIKSERLYRLLRLVNVYIGEVDKVMDECHAEWSWKVDALCVADYWFIGKLRRPAVELFIFALLWHNPFLLQFQGCDCHEHQLLSFCCICHTLQVNFLFLYPRQSCTWKQGPSRHLSRSAVEAQDTHKAY